MKVLTMKMEILLEPTPNKSLVGECEILLRIKLVTAGKKRWNPDGCSSWPETRQFTPPCSNFIFLIKDIMIAERSTTQLPQL
ncbi:hypothetical protein Tco_0140722 [Tanacetum coccineum]